MKQGKQEIKELESQPLFEWIDDKRLKTQLSKRLILARKRRLETFSQKEVGEILNCSLTKIKEIEKGKTKDFNSINNYLNLMKV